MRTTVVDKPAKTPVPGPAPRRLAIGRHSSISGPHGFSPCPLLDIPFLGGSVMERRLAAILVAEVVEYHRLMKMDEAGTIARLNSHCGELIDPAVARHAGRILYPRGDSSDADTLLCLFPSAAAAVLCAVEVQQGMAERDVDVSAERRIQYRIGINLGDVVLDGQDLYDNGSSSIAMRLAGLARQGGVCITGNVYEIGLPGMNLPFEDGGEIAVLKMSNKNSLRLHAWHWSTP